MRRVLVSLLVLLVQGVFGETSTGCLSLNSFGICQSCPEGLFLFEDGKCRLTSQKRGCLIYGVTESKVVCAECSNGYHISNSTCKPSILNCIKQTQDTCQECSRNYKLIQNSCVSSQPQNLLPSHCISLNQQRKCSSCQQGYHLKGNICIVNSLVCNLTHILKGCLFSSNDKCITCAPNFDLVSGRCRETILPNCLTVNNSMCSVCELFYVAAAGMCLNDNAKSIAGCLRAEGRGCVECSPGYTLGNSTCVQDVRPVFLRRFRQLVVYTELTDYPIRWYTRCTNTDGGVCQSCQKPYILNPSRECVRDIKDMKKYSEISTPTASTNTSTTQWEFNDSNTSTETRWFEMTSKEIATLWGLRLSKSVAMTGGDIGGMFVVYKNQKGVWVCHDRCNTKRVMWNSNIFEWMLFQSIQTNSIRIILTSPSGSISMGVEAFYESPLFVSSDLLSVWTFSSIYSSTLTSPNPLFKTNLTNDSGSLTLQMSDKMYAGFQLTVEGVVRIIKVVLQRGNSSSWISSFVLKYSTNGINFYCVDSCHVYSGLSANSPFVSIYLEIPVFARYMIVVPILWSNSPSLRFDFFYDSKIVLPGCILYNYNGKCTNCSANYTLTNGVCKIKISPPPNCKNMDPNSGRCILCDDGYFLESSGKCPLKTPGCIYTGNTCSACIEGYKLTQGFCTIQSQYLKRMSQISMKLYSSQGTTSNPLFTENCKGLGGWVSKVADSNQWVILSAIETLKILKVVVSPGNVSWLEQFSLFTSNDMKTWTQYSSPLTLSGNTESNLSQIQIFLTPSLTGKSLKIVPLKWGPSGINFNFEAYYYSRQSRGEYYDSNNLDFKSYNDIADVFFSQKVVITEMNTRIGDNGCFTLPSSNNQYLQLSLDQFDKRIANVTTMYIRGSQLRNAWVSSLKLMYSTTYASNFRCYNNCTPIVTGLTSADDLKTFPLQELTNITDIRVYPLTWTNANSMRVEFAME